MKTAIRHQQFRSQRELSTQGKQSNPVHENFLDRPCFGEEEQKASLVIPAKKDPVGHPLALTGIVADPP